MNDFLQWLMNNPVLINSIFIVAGIILLTILGMYVVAFGQGREITIWHLRIGPLEKTVGSKKDSSSHGSAKTSDDMLRSSLQALSDNDQFQHAKGWKTFEKEIIQQLETSREACMMKIKGRDFYMNFGYKEAMIARTRAEKNTRILLQSPHSKHITKEVSDTFRWDSLDEYKMEFQTALTVLKGVINNYKQVIRLYDSMPLLKLYIFDNDIYLSIYTGTVKDKNKDENNIWHLSRHTNPFGISKLIENYFETMWNEGIGLSLVRNQLVSLNQDQYSLSIPVNAEHIQTLKNGITFRHKEFQIKREFHITVIDSSLTPLLKTALENDRLKRDQFFRLIAETDWSYEFCDTFHHLVEDKEYNETDQDAPLHLETIIQMVNVPGLEQFYRKLELLLQIQIPARPLHVTLYTHGSERGIGVSTQDELNEYSHGEVNLQAVLQA